MSPAQAVDAQQGGDASAPLSDESTLAQATHCYVRSLQTCDYSFLSADKHLAPELAAFGRANRVSADAAPDLGFDGGDAGNH
jgi:hypothetical protein